MKRANFSPAFALTALFLTAICLAAAPHTGPNTQPSIIKPENGPSVVQTIAMAERLATWARVNGDPLQMSSAARLLASNPPQPMPSDQNHRKQPGSRSAPAVPSTQPLSGQALFKEATQMAGDDKAMVAAIGAMEKSIPTMQGHPGGGLIDHDVLPPDGGTMTYTITFAGNEPMEVSIFADNEKAVDWHVYDENGNDVASQAADHFLSTPKWTGPFKIVLTNRTKEVLPYTIATN